jgi:hypothetical protein
MKIGLRLQTLDAEVDTQTARSRYYDPIGLSCENRIVTELH